MRTNSCNTPAGTPASTAGKIEAGTDDAFGADQGAFYFLDRFFGRELTAAGAPDDVFDSPIGPDDETGKRLRLGSLVLFLEADDDLMLRP